MVSLLVVTIIIVGSIIEPVFGMSLLLGGYLINAMFLNSESLMTGNDPVFGLILPVIIFSITLFKSRHKISSFRVKSFDVYMFAVGAWLLAGVLYAPSASQALLVTVKYFGLGISYYYVIRVYLDGNSHPRKYIHAAISAIWLSGLITGTVALYKQQHLNGFDRLNIAGTSSIPLSLSLGLALLINLYCILKGITPIKHIPKVVRYISFVYLFILFAKTNTRGPALSLFLSTITLIYFAMKSRGLFHSRIIKRLVAVAVILTCIGMTSTLFSINWSPIIQRFSLLFQSGDASVGLRLSGISDAWSLFSEHILVGVGTGGFAYYSVLIYPHGILWEMLSEHGVVGVLLLTMAVVCALVLIMRFRQNSHFDLGELLIVMVLYAFIEYQFSFQLWMDKDLFFTLGLLMSFAYNISRNPTSETSKVQIERVSPSQTLTRRTSI